MHQLVSQTQEGARARRPGHPPRNLRALDMRGDEYAVTDILSETGLSR